MSHGDDLRSISSMEDSARGEPNRSVLALTIITAVFAIVRKSPEWSWLYSYEVAGGGPNRLRPAERRPRPAGNRRSDVEGWNSPR